MHYTKRKHTVAQAIVHFLNNQYVERDAKKTKFFAGMWGIFGHGNVAGIGQALEEIPSFTYYQARNEQGMVHASAAFAKQSRRLSTFACTASIGPGSTNMVTAAAGATINRLPVLLLPGDIFARRQAGPVLQQLEHSSSFDISVNDCFRPVSRFWDRIYRWEQLPESLTEAMRVLSSPSETGTVTLSLPQDVQAEAGLFPNWFFEERVSSIVRTLPSPLLLDEIVKRLLSSKRPLIISGGGVPYSEAESELADLCFLTKIPSVETQAGKGSLSSTHPQNLGAVGVTGTQCANRIAAQADLILAIGTRLSDFTTASGTQFANPSVQFVNINVDPRDCSKYNAFPVLADAKIAISELKKRLLEKNYQVSLFYQEDIHLEKKTWTEIRSSILNPENPEFSQAEVLGILNQDLLSEDTVIAAAGSLPGDMHKLLDLNHSSQYHMEYGYSCMGYEIAGALGLKMQKDEGEVFVLVGDGSYLMMHTEILTSIQEHKKLIIILIINDKFACIDNLSKSAGSEGFGNEFRSRSEDGFLHGDFVNVDYVANARSLGAEAVLVHSRKEFETALEHARNARKTYLIAARVRASANVPGFDSRWNVPVSEIAISQNVQSARKHYVSTFLKENL